MPKIGSVSSCSKLERVFIFNITYGGQVNWPIAIFHHSIKAKNHMVYGHLIMELCRVYEIVILIQASHFKEIKKKFFYDSHFHNLYSGNSLTGYKS